MINGFGSSFFISNSHFDDFKALQKELEVSLLDSKNKEKRRRNLTNFFWQRLVPQNTYFDFFSKDAIEVLLIAKKIAQTLQQKEVTEDMILLGLYLIPQSGMTLLFSKYGICSKDLIKAYLDNKKFKNFSKDSLVIFEKNLLKLMAIRSRKSFFERKIARFVSLSTKILDKLKKVVFSFLNKKCSKQKDFIFIQFLYKFFFYKRSLKNIKFSQKCLLFFEKVVASAEKKYKTPIISVDLLILFLLDSKSGKKLFFPLKNSLDFYNIKYFFVKRLYVQESYLKEEITKKRRHFSYLLKSLISKRDFEKLIGKEDLLITGDLKIKTNSLRDFLVKRIIKVNIFKRLEKEILKSVFISSKQRAYKYL